MTVTELYLFWCIQRTQFHSLHFHLIANWISSSINWAQTSWFGQINLWLILEPFNTIIILRTPPNPLLKCISTTQNINKQHPFEIHQSICQCEAAIPNQQRPLPADWLTFQWFWQMSKRTKKREAHSTIYISVYIQTRTSAPPLPPLIFFSFNSWKNKELLLQRKPWQKLLPKSTSHFYVSR